jgi:YesN/AraC family two-component response regulator
MRTNEYVKCTCVVLIKPESCAILLPYIRDQVEVVVKQEMKGLTQAVRTKNIHCVILFCEKTNQFNCNKLSQFIKKFPSIPIIVILAEKWVDLSRAYGQIGVTRVLHLSEIRKLSVEIHQLICQYSIRVTLNEIGIKEIRGSEILINALDVIEKNYITLMEVKEIADILEINECTLSREFRKHDLIGPKRILMFLKVHHAFKLKENTGLNCQEVALLSGFSDSRRMFDCFERYNKYNSNDSLAD